MDARAAHEPHHHHYQQLTAWTLQVPLDLRGGWLLREALAGSGRQMGICTQLLGSSDSESGGGGRSGFAAARGGGCLECFS